MRKVALHGSYFGYNFGDTLLCALFCNWLKLHPETRVVLPLASRRNMQLIGADARGIIAFLSCRTLVLCGGGYFGDAGSYSLKWSVRNYLRHFLIAEVALLLRKRIVVLGTGVGPISSAFLRRRLRRIINRSECVIVRDQESHDFLKQLCVSVTPQVDVDAAMYLSRSFFADEPRDVPNEIDRKNPIRVVAVHLTNFGATVWDEMAVVLVDFFAKNPHLTPLLITDSAPRLGRVAAQDKASDRLKQLIPSAVQINYDGDPRILCQLLDRVDLVVTNKLHVGIVSLVLGKNVISVPQHVKTPRFYRQIGMPDICVVEDVSSGLRKLLERWIRNGLPRLETYSRNNVYLEAIERQIGVR